MKLRILTISFLFYLFCLLFPMVATGQNNFVSIQLSHPVPVGETFYSNFNGVGGIDINYAQPLNKYLFLSYNLGFLISRSTQYDHINLNMYRSGLGLSVPIKISPRMDLQPQIDLGYVLMKFYNKTIALENKTSSLRRAESTDLRGLQSGFLMSWNYKLNDKFSLGLTTGYEFIYVDRELFATPFNQEMHSVGVGLKTIIHL